MALIWLLQLLDFFGDGSMLPDEGLEFLGIPKGSNAVSSMILLIAIYRSVTPKGAASAVS
ncbi:hypothetical protein JJJ17_13480 [Paracoccus caeni]|uniref:Uncharacterized protein n=1 Tax=Paracoccus caeni TaxID=657651 RepID=A0A934SM91_9RHOB|nr:hypothetical protein [Paracoccus caeni]MBK4216943.1 hypothetical protein [Paracoccus caeni]